jgi:hypothetical protein
LHWYYSLKETGGLINMETAEAWFLILKKYEAQYTCFVKLQKDVFNGEAEFAMLTIEENEGGVPGMGVRLPTEYRCLRYNCAGEGDPTLVHEDVKLYSGGDSDYLPLIETVLYVLMERTPGMVLLPEGDLAEDVSGMDAALYKELCGEEFDSDRCLEILRQGTARYHEEKFYLSADYGRDPGAGLYEQLKIRWKDPMAYIRVHVSDQDSTTEMQYDLTPTSTLGQVLCQYAKTKGIDPQKIQFTCPTPIRVTYTDVLAADFGENQPYHYGWKADDTVADLLFPEYLGGRRTEAILWDGIGDLYITAVVEAPEVCLSISCIDGTSVSCNLPANALVHSLHNLIATVTIRCACMLI